MIWIISFLLLLFILHSWKTKVDYLSIRQGRKKMNARVIMYKKEKVPMRNDFTKISYPYVEILNSEKHPNVIKIRYANSWSKPFKLGQKIAVFFYAGELMYWHAYDRGYSKYLPSKWKFWNV